MNNYIEFGLRIQGKIQKIRFARTDKLNVSGGSGSKPSAAAMTAMSELGTVWIMHQSIAANKNWKDYLEIKEDKDTWEELVKIWTLIGRDMQGPDDEWLETFWESNQAFVRKVSNPSFTEFTRGSSTRKQYKLCVAWNEYRFIYGLDF